MSRRAPLERIRIQLWGAVQGVGFRPFVFRVATELGLRGWARNTSSGLTVEVEGAPEETTRFLDRIYRERPSPAVILAREVTRLEPIGFTAFQIRESEDAREITAAVLPDLATCSECLRELFDPMNRRAGYPFTNCTLCGPRYSIVLDIPYDRPNTTMREFAMCPDCLREYVDPADRRFHAQPNACARCGPRLDDTIERVAEALADGRIVALKGVGGFQLLCDARNAEAAQRLRQRKSREEKPFALMMPSITEVRHYCRISPEEEAVLSSAAAPIVLLDGSGVPGIASNVAQGSPYLGVMLPYSPVHHLLLRAFPFPVVATSGNRSEEPIAIGNEEAVERLSGIADVFLMHDRPIACPCDDSVVRVARSGVAILRRSRGYVPLPIAVGEDLRPVLAAGGHLKNTVAIAVGKQVFLSQHIGDLDSAETRRSFQNAIEDLCRLYRFEPVAVACDLHPDYASSLWARASGLRVVEVQHHQAHAAACAAENGLPEPYLAVVWDGAGYGLDGSIWGGEFFVVTNGRFERIAHLRPFRLPGGEAAMREGWRAAASLVWEALGPEHIRDGVLPAGVNRSLLWRMLEGRVNAPATTSVGRLFDAAAALTGIALRNRFEGQAAMLLEWEIGPVNTQDAYSIPCGDWAPLIEELVTDIGRGVARSRMAARFHNALVNWVLNIAEQTGVPRVAMSGGVFQNRYLTQRATDLLESRGFSVYSHRQVPPNDGGIALGQAVLAGRC